MEDEGVRPRGSDRVSHREVSSLLICRLPTSNKRSALISWRIQPAGQGHIPHGSCAWIGCLAKNRLAFVPVGLGVSLGNGGPRVVAIMFF